MNNVKIGLIADMRSIGRIGPGGLEEAMPGEDRQDRMGGMSAVEQREFYDNLSGEWLNPDMVKEARQAEMEEMHRHKEYEKVPVEEC